MHEYAFTYAFQEMPVKYFSEGLDLVVELQRFPPDTFFNIFKYFLAEVTSRKSAKFYFKEMLP